ncbi:SUKH-4 family immunity protein [Streptacidiphilus sp. PAMC 29251]
MVDARTVLEQFGEAKVRRISDPAFLARIGDATSRALLEHVGLPIAALKIFALAEHFVEGMRTWSEQLETEPDSIPPDVDEVPGSGDWFVVGDLLQATVLLDGATGAVYQLSEIGGAPEQLNRDLNAFLGYLCAFEAATAECSREAKARTPGVDYYDFCAAVGEHLKRDLLAIDAEALADEDGHWGNTLFEVSEAMW